MTTQGTTPTVVLDGVDVTPYCLDGSATRRLNRPGIASARINMQALSALFGTTMPTAGSYLKVYFDTYTDPLIGGHLFHHGRVMDREITANEEGGYAVFNSSDPLELWQQRPVRDSSGDFSDPTIIDDNIYGPQMIQDMCINSQCRGGALTPPQDCEGPLRLKLNSFEGGVTNLTGAPQDWPMTMAEFANLLISTGVMDIVVTPIEFDANDNYGQLDVYNNYTTDLTATVKFQYGMGARNVRALRWNTDMTNVCNKLWYYLGQRKDANHWPANITGTDEAFNPDANPTGAWVNATPYVINDLVTAGGITYVCIETHISTATTHPGVGVSWQQKWTYYLTPPGGKLAPPASPSLIGTKRGFSQAEFDIRMDIQVFDADNAKMPGVRDLWKVQWQRESFLRAFPRDLVHVTPIRDTAVGTFNIGDLVLVEAASEVGGGFSGGQRVYEYTVSWDAAESVCEVSELQVSSDQEGI